ncbi:MAG: protein kinase [Thermoanaerobaculia bacterium]|nr:protein kinase [Thermoanaerobaculia bacterium]
MSEITCLRCNEEFDEQSPECPSCGDKVTDFQRTYSTRLLDGKYELVTRLGLGGMGEIFKVRHVHLGEERVVKIMRANIATDDDALQRFLHEARLATMIKHRNLAMLYDFATLEDGSYYMVWEFIDGSNVQKWISENGPMPPRIVVEISLQALAGLNALHEMGVIHRDISPENIMITQDYQENLLCKVIDFGIAKQLSEGESGQGLTQTGMFLGKLKYASPEQAGFLKEGEQLDARSDLYSFGIVMYEMLAGRAPFVSTNPQSYILKHATEKPVSISEVNPDVEVPPELEEIVLRVLEKDRSDRPVGAKALIDELEEIREDIPPDEKLGLGDKLVTISQAKTVADLTASGRTSRTTRKKEKPTAAGTSDATVVERLGDDEATVVEKKPAGEQAEATVVEAKGRGPATRATVVDRQTPSEEAAPTVIEKVDKYGAKKSKAGLMAALAAVVILSIGGAVWVFGMRDTAAPETDVDATVEVPATTTDPHAGPLEPGEGALLLAANRGELTELVNSETDEEIPLQIEDRSLPLRLHLEPGTYELEIRDGSGQVQTETATVIAGREIPIHPRFTKPDIDKLVDDILRQ